MEPLAAGAIAAPIVGGILQAKFAQDAAAMNASERARIAELISKIQDPQFDMRQFTPEEYQLVGKYAPQAIPYVEEAAPQLVKLSAAGQQGQDATLSALQRLRGIAQTGTDSQSQALVEQAQKQAAIQNQGNQASIMDSMQRRGGGAGSGLGLAAALSSAQGANQAASTAGTNAALQAYENRLNALRDSANIGSQVQNSDVSMQGRNADIINGFNQRMAAMRNANNTANTNNINDAQLKNLQASQATANANVDLRNNAVAQKNALAQQQFNNSLNKVGMQTNNINNLIQDNTSAARDKNNAIQGVASGVSSGLLYASDAQKRKKEEGYY